MLYYVLTPAASVTGEMIERWSVIWWHLLKAIPLILTYEKLYDYVTAAISHLSAYHCFRSGQSGQKTAITRTER